MKKVILLAALFIASLSATAQIPDGSIAPDFTATDINGVTHNLYDILDEGKTVILDLSATWCPPCWSYHNSGALDGVYECYGEPGSDDVVVFMVEGDPNTTTAELYGPVGTSLGDWVTGTPYPIIESSAIADAYQLAYWPTIFRICPSDKTVYELGQVGTAAAKNAVLNQTCTPPVRNDDPALTCSHSGKKDCAGFETEVSVNLFNSGSNPMTAATITAYLDGVEVGSVDWTGNLNTYQEESVSIGTAVIVEPGDVVFEISNVTDERMSNNDAIASFDTAPAFLFDEGNDTLVVDIRTDNYGNETYWAVLDDAGAVIAEGGNTGVGLTNIGNGGGSAPANAGSYGNNATISIEVIVPVDGCYNFVVTDYYGDGMCCAYGSGYYKLSDSQGNVLFEGGEFAGRDDNAFEKASVVSNEEVILANKLVAFPNPVQNNLTINFSLLETVRVNVEVVNSIGQVVYLEDAGNLLSGEYNINVDMNGFQSGLYFVNLVTEHGITTQRVIKQ